MSKHKAGASFSIAFALLLGGCTYTLPAALPVAADPAPLALPDNVPTRIGLAQALELAHSRNLDARAADARFRVAQAQGGLDGAVPDPQLSLSADHPTKDASAVDALGSGLSLDTMALMTGPARRAKVAAGFDQADAERRWALAQLDARVLHAVITLAAARQRAAMLKPYERDLTGLSSRARSALASGDLGIDQAAPLVAAASDTHALLLAAERQVVTAEAELRGLLTLGTRHPMDIAVSDPPKAAPKSDIDTAMAELGTVRPDLAALRHGYLVQDATRAEAVLAQFPAINIGIQAARDTGNLKTLGGTVGLSVPIFGSAQRNLAVQEATLDQLRAEYEARLVQSGYDVRRLIAEIDVLDGNARTLGIEVPKLRAESGAALAAFARGDVSGLVLAPYQTAVIAREMELIDLWEARWANWIDLNLSLGRDLLVAVQESSSL